MPAAFLTRKDYDLDPNFSPSQLAELYGVSRQRVWALAKLYNVQLKGMNRAKRTRTTSSCQDSTRLPRNKSTRQTLPDASSGPSNCSATTSRPKAITSRSQVAKIPVSSRSWPTCPASNTTRTIPKPPLTRRSLSDSSNSITRTFNGRFLPSI